MFDLKTLSLSDLTDLKSLFDLADGKIDDPATAVALRALAEFAIDWLNSAIMERSKIAGRLVAPYLKRIATEAVEAFIKARAGGGLAVTSNAAVSAKDIADFRNMLGQVLSDLADGDIDHVETADAIRGVAKAGVDLLGTALTAQSWIVGILVFPILSKIAADAVESLIKSRMAVAPA